MNKSSNNAYLWIAIVATILEWILFKLAYPFPDFFHDSYGYIVAANNELNISIWPIGYSKFLLLFHIITHSATSLVSFQFFSLEAASWYFFVLLEPSLTLVNGLL
jgi:hypothetical protein